MNTFFCHLPYSKERGLGIIAKGVRDCFVFPDNVTEKDWNQLESWLQKWKGQWILSISGFESGFCFLQISISNKDITQAPQGVWVVPEEMEVLVNNNLLDTNSSVNQPHFGGVETAMQYQSELSKIHNHLLKGDIYETNYCTYLQSEMDWTNPYDIWKKLYTANPAPFAGYWQWNHHHLLCLSPERFIQKIDHQIISQPIKGTIKRGENPALDNDLKNQLLHHPKERNENVMIVDLVRNDLSRVATKGSVKVKELFGIYTFPKLHHMISTVECQINADKKTTNVFRATFPMGSMTGVPKKRAVELMHKYEKSARGWYSGTMGYIQPNGDFDFNVIIRSIQYNHELKMGKIGIGSAITLQSNPESEWNECWLKAQSLIQPLS